MSRPKIPSLATLRSRKRRGFPLSEQEANRVRLANIRQGAKARDTRIDNMLKKEPTSEEEALKFIELRDKRKRKVDPNKAFLMKAQGKTAAEIAAYFDATENTVWKCLRQLKVKKNLEEDVKEFKNKRADVLTFIQGMVLENITVNDVKKASLKDKTAAFSILFDKERLERGQATSIDSLFMHIVDSACQEDNS